MMNLKKKIIITGGLGYIGSVLIEKILAQNYELVVFDNLPKEKLNSFNKIQNSKFVIINSDIRNIEEWKAAVKGVNTVIHLAGVSDGIAGKLNPKLTKEVNQLAFPALVRESKKAGVSRFILASTFSVYGNEYNIPLKEELVLRPKDPYSISKAFGEAVLKEENTENFTTTSLRIAMVYGWSPTMRFEFIVNNMVKRAIQQKKLAVFGGEQRRPQIHIQDITDYFMKLLEYDKVLISNQVFNAGGQNPTISDIANKIQAYLGNVEIEYVPKRDKKEDSFVLNSDKIASWLNLKPSWSLDMGIEEIVNNFKIKNRYYEMD